MLQFLWAELIGIIMMTIMLGLLGVELIHPTVIKDLPSLNSDRHISSLLCEMSSLTPGLVFVTIFIALLPLQASAFGAGDIPDFAYLNGASYHPSTIRHRANETPFI